MNEEKKIKRNAMIAGVILAFIIAVIIVGYVFYLSPPVEQKYREKWLKQEAGKIPAFASPEMCAECHQEEYSYWNESIHHSSVQCEDCHGASMRHVEMPENIKYLPTVDTSREFCGTCHESIPPRDESPSIKTVDLSTHNPDYPCISCHLPHRT